ncbi:hypothetical protein AB0M68_32465 [Streptomyces sp. NPDC051453]|uniref:hypothetical protein n=1 Tax=Streptomyces sp. NPDC051453 TaxID=3154941 RepID=UPI00341FD4FD
MAIRLAVIGAALLVGGLVNVTGFGKFTAPLGVVALACSGVLFARDRNSSRRR